MTQPNPFTPVVEHHDKRDPSEFIPWMRCAEMQTPRGMRPGKLLVIRPLEQIEDFRVREGADPNAWRGKLTIADVACLDPIEPAQDEYGMPLIGYQAGHQFRDQLVFPGYLNKAFRDYVGKTIIGTLYLGPNTKGKPPLMWRDLGSDPAAVQRGQRFLAAFPDFLIPTKAAITAAQPNAGDSFHPAANGYHQPQAQPVYQQDPWAQQAQPVSAQPQSAPPAVGNTLDQMRALANGGQGAQSSETPPF